MTNETTHFGFKTVKEDEKETLVRDVFDSVAGSYDLMNDLMSLGVHRLWKDGMIEWLNPRKNMHLLDVGGGTGDIAFRFLKRGGGSVVVSDINPNMLEVGKKRALDKGYIENINWQEADVENLPFEDESFDAVTIAFCIRNVTHPEQGLREMYRVLKPGGRFLCLEFSQVTSAGFDKLYDWWSFNILPKIGEKVAKDKDSYQYLAESIRKFPTQEVWAEKIREAGFKNVKYRNYTHGVAALHSGWKI
ncbi:MAG: bifunctional demethylmenaquinone methyltransferase/2-methoxy-6-polyprenyl-1,4-benzoquinol methylase UbiE [Alphaproteobacteria bacterium]